MLGLQLFVYFKRLSNAFNKYWYEETPSIFAECNRIYSSRLIISDVQTFRLSAHSDGGTLSIIRL